MNRIGTVFCAALLLGVLSLSAQTGQWEHFTYGGEIRSLASHGNTVWIGSTAGLLKYDTQTQARQFFDKANSPLGDNWISALAVSPSGILWIGGPFGLIRVEDGNWQTYDSSNSAMVTQGVFEIFCLSDTELWLLSKYNANHDYVYHIVGDEWTAYSAANCPIGGSVIWDMALDAQGLPWLTYSNSYSNSYGISRFDGSSWHSQSMAAMGLPNDPLYRIAHDGEQAWVSSFSGTLYSIGQDGAETHDLSAPPYNLHHISILRLDAQGRLLVGYVTWDSTPYLLLRQAGNWEMLNPNGSVPGLSAPYALAGTAQGDVWFGTNRGMAVFDGSGWSGFDCSKSPLPSNSVTSLAVSTQDVIWLAIRDVAEDYYALVKKDGEGWTVYDAADQNLIGEPGSLTSGGDGKVWFWDESSESLVCFDGTAWQSFNPAASTLPAGTLNCLRLDQFDRPWLALSGNDGQRRIYRFEQGTWEQMAVFLWSVRDMVFDGAGDPWLATNGGLVHLDGGIEVYNTQNSGLPNDDVTCLDYDADRNLWIGTTTGLAKYANGVWEAWDPQHGNHPNRMLVELATDQAGRVWAATHNTGLVCFDGTEWTIYNQQNSPLLTDWANIDIDSADNLWIKNQGQGFTRFTPSTTASAEHNQGPAAQARLNNYPNPFNPSTTISFSLPEAGSARLSIHNAKGQLVKELYQDTSVPRGEHSFVWNGTDRQGREVSSGVYFARLQTKSGSQGLKLLLMK